MSTREGDHIDPWAQTRPEVVVFSVELHVPTVRVHIGGHDRAE